MIQIDKPEMTITDVLELVKLCDENQIEVIIDEGWGVDALLGQQTRPHADLDIAMQHKYVPELRRLLEAEGYKDVPRPDTRECNFVLGDDLGHEVDIHTYTYDEQGNLVFGLPYPLDSLNGIALIANYPVRCITPEWMVKFHSGYQLDENDFHDVKALCRRYGIEMPAEFKDYEMKQEIR